MFTLRLFVRRHPDGSYVYDAAGKPVIGSELIPDMPADTGPERQFTADELREALGDLPSGDMVEFTAEGGFRVKKEVGEARVSHEDNEKEGLVPDSECSLV